MLVSQTNPVGIELFSYVNAFFCRNKFTQPLATWVKRLKDASILIFSCSRSVCRVSKLVGPLLGWFSLAIESESDRKRIRKSLCDLVKITNRSRKGSHKRDGIGVGRIRTFLLSSDSGFSENEIVGVGNRSRRVNKPITMQVPTLCDWFSSGPSCSKGG